MSLSAVNACLRTRRQHPPDHQMTGQESHTGPSDQIPGPRGPNKCNGLVRRMIQQVFCCWPLAALAEAIITAWIEWSGISTAAESTKTRGLAMTEPMRTPANQGTPIGATYRIDRGAAARDRGVQIAAAQLRLVTDRRLGKETPDWVRQLAAENPRRDVS